MEILLLVRHGQSVFNVDGVINGDPALDRGLSPAGAGQAQQLEPQLAGIAIGLSVTSEFPRAKETARLALGSRAETTATIVDPDLNDIRIGTLEGQSLDAYHAWKRVHSASASFPGGESLGDAAQRYAAAFERVLARRERRVLCVCHEIPVRYAVNAARGSDELDGPLHDIPNATPYLFDEDAVRRAIVGLRELAPARG